ncbi:hypothetical protein PAPHI01_0220 [Pancytospora philotis]|nr:hypothetical protein PAPHI01_0220 [Pancytospora philotis]
MAAPTNGGYGSGGVDPRDIVHSGGLDGITDFRVFRLRYPRRVSAEPRLLTDWFVQEVANAVVPGVCLVGQCKNAIIRTSPVTGILSSKRVLTCSGVYVLSDTNKVLENPLKNGAHNLFVNGFPANWKEAVQQALSASANSETVLEVHNKSEPSIIAPSPKKKLSVVPRKSLPEDKENISLEPSDDAHVDDAHADGAPVSNSASPVVGQLSEAAQKELREFNELSFILDDSKLLVPAEETSAKEKKNEAAARELPPARPNAFNNFFLDTSAADVINQSQVFDAGNDSRIATAQEGGLPADDLVDEAAPPASSGSNHSFTAEVDALCAKSLVSDSAESPAATAPPTQHRLSGSSTFMTVDEVLKTTPFYKRQSEPAAVQEVASPGTTRHSATEAAAEGMLTKRRNSYPHTDDSAKDSGKHAALSFITEMDSLVKESQSAQAAPACDRSITSNSSRQEEPAEFSLRAILKSKRSTLDSCNSSSSLLTAEPLSSKILANGAFSPTRRNSMDSTGRSRLSVDGASAARGSVAPGDNESELRAAHSSVISACLADSSVAVPRSKPAVQKPSASPAAASDDIKPNLSLLSTHIAAVKRSLPIKICITPSNTPEEQLSESPIEVSHAAQLPEPAEILGGFIPEAVDTSRHEEAQEAAKQLPAKDRRRTLSIDGAALRATTAKSPKKLPGRPPKLSPPAQVAEHSTDEDLLVVDEDVSSEVAEIPIRRSLSIEQAPKSPGSKRRSSVSTILEAINSSQTKSPRKKRRSVADADAIIVDDEELEEQPAARASVVAAESPADLEALETPQTDGRPKTSVKKKKRSGICRYIKK